jgi:hypothetical protein
MVAAVMAAPTAHAKGAFDVGLMHKEVTVVTPPTLGFLDHFTGAIIGPSIGIGFPLGEKGWGWGAEFGLGWGGETNEGDFLGTPFEEKVSITGWNGSIQIGYMGEVSGFDLYASGGLGYESASATFDDGTTEVDGESFNTFGLVTTCGSNIPFGEKFKFYGELSHIFGWGSAEDGGSKFSRNVQYGEVRAGLRFGF